MVTGSNVLKIVTLIISWFLFIFFRNKIKCKVPFILLLPYALEFIFQRIALLNF